MTNNGIYRPDGNQCAVSTVLPVYNMEKYIGEAIESILNQSFTDFELIVIDDASTDSTYEIIQSYKDSRMTVLRNDVNTGNYPSRNRGMSIARGKYIAVMDGDDISMPERFAVQYAFMEKNPDLSACGSFNTLAGSVMECPQNCEDIMFALLINNCFFHSSLFMRKKVIDTTGYYNENYTYASDYDIICRMALAGKLMILPEKLIHYRFHPDQITRSHRHEQRKFADQIRRKYQLALIERYPVAGTYMPNETDLAFPVTGRIIFFYHYAKNSHSMEYKKKADELFDKILNRLNASDPVRMKDGLSGLGCGLMYLLRNGFVKGDEDLILKTTDTAVRSVIIDGFKDAGRSPVLCEILAYLTGRLEKVPDSISEPYLYNRNSLNRLLDSLDSVSETDGFDRELFVSLLRKLLQHQLFLPKVNSLLNKYQASDPETNAGKNGRISIYAVIVLYNGMKWYGRCFGSLRESSFPVHIVAIDNASGDETVSCISANYPDVCLIRSETNMGFAKACNIGIRHALKHHADYIFLLNQDAWIKKDTLNILLDVFLKNPDAGIVSPVHLNGTGRSIDKTFINYLPGDFISDMYTGCMKSVYRVPFVNAAAWLLSCECIKNTGYFDTNLFVHYGEDDNFCQRVLYHGYRIYIHTGTNVFHDRIERSRKYMQSVFAEENEFLSVKKKLGNINVYYDLKKYIFNAKRSILTHFFLMKSSKINYLRRYITALKKIRDSRDSNVRICNCSNGLELPVNTKKIR